MDFFYLSNLILQSTYNFYGNLNFINKQIILLILVSSYRG